MDIMVILEKSVKYLHSAVPGIVLLNNKFSLPENWL